MKRSNDEDESILDNNNLAIDPIFERNLLASLKKADRKMNTTNPPIPNWRSKLLPISGIGFATLAVMAAVLLSSASTSVQTAYAYEVFNELKQKPIGSAELIQEIKKDDADGRFVHKQTRIEFGPGYNECVYGDPSFAPEQTDTPGIESIDTLYYSKSPELEVFYEFTGGNKATEPVMVYDEAIEFDRLSKLIGTDEGQYSYLRDIGQLVDENGTALDEKSQLTKQTANGNEVYQLYLRGTEKGFCTTYDVETGTSTFDQESEILAITVDANSLAIRELSLYDNGAARDENRVQTTKIETLKDEKGNFDSFKAEFTSRGFDEDVARRNAEAYNQASSQSNDGELFANLVTADGFGAWGTGTGYDPTDDVSDPAMGSYFYTFNDRQDVRIHFYGRKMRLQGDGFPSGIHGFEKATENGKTVFRDVYFATILAETPDLNYDPSAVYIWGDVQEELTIDGKQAITVRAESAFASGGSFFYTIINTGDPNFPAMIIEEDAEKHVQFEDNWQHFIDSINFVSN